MKRLKSVNGETWLKIAAAVALLILFLSYQRAFNLLAFFQAHAAGKFDPHCLPCVVMVTVCFVGSFWLTMEVFLKPIANYKKIVK
jgi:uncharacterized membrane protein